MLSRLVLVYFTTSAVQKSHTGWVKPHPYTYAHAPLEVKPRPYTMRSM